MVVCIGVVSTLAGSGTAAWAEGVGTAANFNLPFGISVDSNGAVFVADMNNHRIRKINSAGIDDSNCILLLFGGALVLLKF